MFISSGTKVKVTEGCDAVLEPASDEDGYVSPDFDLSDYSEGKSEVAPPHKRSKASKQEPPSVDADEELALQLLRAS